MTTVLKLTLAGFLVIEGAVLLGLWFFRERSDAGGAAPWPLGRDLACTVLPAALLALIAVPFLATCLTPMATP